LYNKGVRRFCIDMAHGDSIACVDTIKYIKSLFNNSSKKNYYEKKFQDNHIIAGNVATVIGFKRLQKAGANGIRAGIASGAICSTAIETGFGVPILTNIIDMAKYKKKNTWLIADGGCKATGDIAKAVYFGADFVMLGKMLASTDLACGSCYNKNKEKLKQNIKMKSDEDYFACVYPH
jgi:IMP dehydrogenase